MERAQIVSAAAILRYSSPIQNIELLTVFNNSTQRYEFPGGRVENGETIWDTAVKGAKESVGAEIQLVNNNALRYTYYTHKNKSGLNEIFIFSARIVSEEPRVVDEGTKVVESGKFEKMLWQPINRYLERRMPVMEYVTWFANDTRVSSFNEVFKREILGLESMI